VSTFLLAVPLIAFVMSLALAILVILRNHRSSVYRLFFLFLIGMALWGFITFELRISPNQHNALTWDRFLMPVVVFSSVTFLHFSYLHTRFRPRKWALPVIYSILVLIIALSPTNLTIKSIGIDQYGYYPIAGPLFYLDALLSYLFFILGLVNFSKGYRASTLHSEKNSYLYVIAGVYSFLAMGVVDLFSIFSSSIPPVALVGNIIFCTLATIALLKYRLLDMKIVLKKGIAYFMVSTMLAIPYVSSVFLLYWVFKQTLPIWAYFAVLLLLAFTVHPLWVRIQYIVDRWFYRNRYDYLKTLQDYSQETHNISDLKQLSSSFVKLIVRALRATNAHLLLSVSTGEFNVIASTGENTLVFSLDGDSSLLQWLRVNQRILYQQDLDTIPILQSLTTKQRDIFDTINAKLFVPVITKEKELVGILIIGENLSQQLYSTEDERLVLFVVDHMATELENALLYETERELIKELEKQDTLKTEFLHSIAHELKTPLTAILSSSELLDDELVSSGNTEIKSRLINNIMQGSTLVNRRVSELLDIARMEQFGNDDMKLNIEIIEISEFITQCVERVKIMFDISEQRLKMEVSNTLPEIQGDRERLEQVVFNLLSNANKYSPQDSEIVIKAICNKKAIVIEVEDEAPLVTDEEKDKIFKPYYRGEDAEKRRQHPGLGLGLAISKRIIDSHNGEMWVRNKSNGNIFGFSLPVSGVDDLP
jgi:signal transduction histidine kinase